MSSEQTGVIADRYATALFELAQQQGGFDQVAADLRTLKQMIAESADLRRVLRSPIMTRDEQQKAMNALAAIGNISDLSRKFLGTLAKNRRLASLPGMIGAYLQRLAAHRGEVTAEVTSATKLSEAQLNALGAALKQAVGGTVSIETAVDPSLLGGLVVKVGSRMVDSSLRTKLQHLQLVMKGVG